MSGFVAESRWRHLGLGSALRERVGKQYKGTQRTRKAVHGECTVELAKWTFPIISLCREPYEAKVSRTGLTGGMGRRTVRQRALCLPSDVLSDGCLTPADRRDVVSPSPEMIPCIVLTSSHEGPCNMDGRFPLDEAHDLGHRVLRGNREQHVDVIGHQVHLFNPPSLLLGHRANDFTKMASQLVVECFPTVLRDKHHVIRAVPRGMA